MSMCGEEKIQFILYKNKKTKNELQNLIMIILKSMRSPSIAESFGHNKASLYRRQDR